MMFISKKNRLQLAFILSVFVGATTATQSQGQTTPRFLSESFSEEGPFDIDMATPRPIEVLRRLSPTERVHSFCVQGECGLIDSEHTWVVPPQAEHFSRIGNGHLAVRHLGRLGLVDLAGDWVLPPVFQDISSTGSSSAFIVRLDIAEHGIISASGEWLVPPVFERIDILSPGVLRVLVDQGRYTDDHEQFYAIYNLRRGWSNTRYSYISGPNSGLVIASPYGENRPYGVLDATENWVVEPRFDSAGWWGPSDHMIVIVGEGVGLFSVRSGWLQQPVYQNIVFQFPDESILAVRDDQVALFGLSGERLATYDVSQEVVERLSRQQNSLSLELRFLWNRNFRDDAYAYAVNSANISLTSDGRVLPTGEADQSETGVQLMQSEDGLWGVATARRLGGEHWIIEPEFRWLRRSSVDGIYIGSRPSGELAAGCVFLHEDGRELELLSDRLVEQEGAFWVLCGRDVALSDGTILFRSSILISDMAQIEPSMP